MGLSYNSDSIRSMSDMEHIRARTGMYGFETDSIQGNLMQMKEILDNAVDEAKIDRSKLYDIDVTIRTAGSRYQVIIRDHGRGIPIDKLTPSFTKMHTSGKYDDGAYDISVGTNGVGSKVTAALSKRLVAMSKRQDGFGYLEVSKGDIKNTDLSKRAMDKDQSTDGTVVFFEPDEEHLTCTKEFISQGGVAQHLELVMFIMAYTKNVKIHVREIKGVLPESTWTMPPKEIWKTLTDTSSGKYVLDPSSVNITPRTYVQKEFSLNKEILFELPLLEKTRDQNNDNDRLGYLVDIFIDAGTIKGRKGVMAAVNGTKIIKSTASHLKVIQGVLKQFIADLIDDRDLESFLMNNYDIPFSGSIMAEWLRAAFFGQDKTQFKDVQFEAAFRNSLRRHLTKLPQETWVNFLSVIENDLLEKFSRYANRNVKVGAGLKGIASRLIRPKSYFDCGTNDSKKAELFIVEGDSAGGQIAMARDSDTQAVYMIRGKLLNVIKASNDRKNANDIYNDTMTILGVTPQSRDLSQMNFSKIIFLTDADPDGKHINTLGLTMLQAINPLILEEGRVYLANPPLYGIRTKDTRAFLRDKIALDSMRINTIYRELLEITLETVKDKQRVVLSGDAFVGFCEKIIRIGNVANIVSRELSTDALILEQLMHVVDYLPPNKIDTKKITDILGIDDVVYRKDGDSIILVMDSQEIPLSLGSLVSELKAYLIPEYDAIFWKNINLYVTTKHSDLYYEEPTSPIRLFRDFKLLNKIFDVTRYKGIGETSYETLEATCMNPLTRCLTRITNIGDLDRIYSLMDENAASRKDLIATGFVEAYEA